MALTEQQIIDLDTMNEASRLAGGLGTILNDGLFGGVPTPSAGTVSPMSVINYTITPSLASTTSVHAAITLPASGTTTVATGITNPDFPRQVTITGVGAGVTGTVSLTGTDINDAVLTEDLTASGTSTVISTKAFKTVNTIVVPVRSTGGETISVGTGAKVGFPVAIPQTTRVLAKNFNGATDAGTVTAGATVSLSVYAAAGTFDGAKELSLLFVAP